MTDEAKALVERLRWGAWYYEDPFDGKAYASDDPLEAADLIETQAREIERLREDVGDRVRIANIFLAEADAEIAWLRGLLLKAANWLKAAPIESDVCCCGDPMDSHDFYDGHMPVDAVQYSAMQLHKEIRAALAGDSHDQ